MRHFGIIGYPLSHSFSPSWFNEKFKREGIDAQYSAYPLQHIDEFPSLVANMDFSGLNVTIPYKEKIMPYLDEIDPAAVSAGAVNVIKFDKGKMSGYNSDVYGFKRSLENFLAGATVKKALVLGTGGSSGAVSAALRQMGISYDKVSRDKKKGLTYRDLDTRIMQEYNLIINTTPLGMYPDVDSKPSIPYETLTENYFIYDLIYNPENTLFLSEGLNRGCKVKNGFEMLILQAEKAWEIWNRP